jgi:hypothetical protein
VTTQKKITHQNSPSQLSISETSTNLDIHSILTEAKTQTVQKQYFFCSEILYELRVPQSSASLKLNSQSPVLLLR